MYDSITRVLVRMSLYASSLILLAAFMHALWNALIKRSDGGVRCMAKSLTITVLTLGTVVILFFPGTISAVDIRQVLPFVAISALIHCIYFSVLSRYYRRADLSYLYCYSRSSAVLLSGLAGIFFFNEQFSMLFLLGACCTVLGIFFLSKYRDGRNAAGFGFSFDGAFLGCLIASAVVTDKAGMQFAQPLLYSLLLFSIAAVLLYASSALVPQTGSYSGASVSLKDILAFGPPVVLTYSMILIALHSENLSRVSSVREISMAFSALLGWYFFGENFPPRKLLSISMLLLGIFFVIHS